MNIERPEVVPGPETEKIGRNIETGKEAESINDILSEIDSLDEQFLGFLEKFGWCQKSRYCYWHQNPSSNALCQKVRSCR